VTKQIKEFNIFSEHDTNLRLKNYENVSFDVSKLEIEYDYETDQEHIDNCRIMLESDLYYAVEFFVKDDPLNLVVNLDGRY